MIGGQGAGRGRILITEGFSPARPHHRERPFASLETLEDFQLRITDRPIADQCAADLVVARRADRAASSLLRKPIWSAPRFTAIAFESYRLSRSRTSSSGSPARKPARTSWRPSKETPATFVLKTHASAIVW